MKSTLKNYRQSPRKVRLLADLVKGKRVDEAKLVLDFTGKRASGTVKKVINSAVANAKENNSISSENDLYIKSITVNEGYTLKRIRPRAMGRAFPIRKRTSHIDVVLDKLENKGKKKTSKTTEKVKKTDLSEEAEKKTNKKEVKKETKPKKK